MLLKRLSVLAGFVFGASVLCSQPAPAPFDPATLFALPIAGQSELRILSPTILELSAVTSPSSEKIPSTPNLATPAGYTVSADGKPVAVKALGFKRRVLYAPLKQRDLRVANSLYLELAEPLAAEVQSITVTAASDGAKLWPAGRDFTARNDPGRFSPVVHVNQEGYEPELPKTAMVGYYLGSLGELHVDAKEFALVDTRTGERVFQGELRGRKDFGYTYAPRPYQSVLEADFSAFQRPGEYRLVVPGLGGSAPFRIGDGTLMNFVRAYALGLYHQRCGTTNELPYTRHVHDACHLAPAEVPLPMSDFAKAWERIGTAHNDPKKAEHPAPVIKDESTLLYPFVRRGKIDVSGGHHDAGDYSKYTINSANLIHALVFAVDALPGVVELDNLGIPESGDGISDLLQEAKWEADFLAKLQDTDGGFYFLVYPRDRSYETGVLPEKGDPQIVWPKNTAATAAAVAALAQCSSSPEFKRRYPDEAKRYFAQARLGWQFLVAAIAKHGKAKAYQKLTHYGDNFQHDDELAWAACEMFVATGGDEYRQKLREWFPEPNSGAARFWGWWHAPFAYGNALRSYAFADRSGRLKAEQLDSLYLAKCRNELRRAGDEVLRWTEQSAYGTAFPEATKRQRAGGWYFSNDHAFDLTVAYQLEPRASYLEAVLANLNYEAGANPVNVSFITGLGLRRQREIVHQYAQADRRVLPPSGIPLGNIQTSFDRLITYREQLRDLSFPEDDAKYAPYPSYDRWSDAYNVTTEFVVTNQGRALASLAFWAARTPSKSAPWRAVRAQIQAPGAAHSLDQPLTFRLVSPELDLADARIVWEGRDNEPAIGETFTMTPKNTGPQWVEAEAQLPDGRRVFAANNFTTHRPIVYWVDGAMPEGAQPTVAGGDTWDWIQPESRPPGLPERTTQQHVSAGTSPQHDHTFTHAQATLSVEKGDTLFAWVWIDPQNPPRQIMLSWNDGGSWEHRAFWGEDLILYGQANSPGRRKIGPLPKPGQWARLEVPAAAVDLEGKNVNGMSFSLHGGRAVWDAAGKSAAKK